MAAVSTAIRISRSRIESIPKYLLVFRSLVDLMMKHTPEACLAPVQEVEKQSPKKRELQSDEDIATS